MRRALSAACSIHRKLVAVVMLTTLAALLVSIGR
jgi:hypothetical protein